MAKWQSRGREKGNGKISEHAGILCSWQALLMYCLVLLPQKMLQELTMFQQLSVL